MDGETREGFIKVLGLIGDLAQNSADSGACVAIAKDCAKWIVELCDPDDAEKQPLDAPASPDPQSQLKGH